MRQNDQAAIRVVGKRNDASLGLFAVLGADFGHLNSERRRDRFGRAQELEVGRRVGVHEHRCSHDLRRSLLEQPQPFAAHGRLEILEARDIAIRAREAADESASDRVRNLNEHSRYFLVELLQNSQGRIAVITIASGADLTSSAASDLTRVASLSDHRTSTAILRPLLRPSFSNVSRKAVTRA